MLLALTPIPLFVWLNNLWFSTIDYFRFLNDPARQGFRPQMYDNWFTKLFMGDPNRIWGAFQWYDMFSWQGFDDYFWDSIAFLLIPWWEIYEAYQREASGDWTYGTVELNNFVDKNRIFCQSLTNDPSDFWNWSIFCQNSFVDPYDFYYWSTNPNGIDCNGNLGYGYYCYCPSQGYNCQCKPNNWDSSGTRRDMCYDHYGYDCDGNLVDGENNWC